MEYFSCVCRETNTASLEIFTQLMTGFGIASELATDYFRYTIGISNTRAVKTSASKYVRNKKCGKSGMGLRLENQFDSSGVGVKRIMQ